MLSLLSIASSSPLRFVTFLFTWFIFRVFVAARNQGQSFGRWLMSVRVIDAEYGKTAGFAAFFKREIFVFICSLFLIETITSTLIVFAWIPFVADAAFAIVDNEKRQAFHDRISSTISIQSRKGFAIDQKLGKLFNQAGQQATRLYQSRQERDPYADEYNAPRSKPKRRPRTKSRPPQDFEQDFESPYPERPYREKTYTDPYEDPLETSYDKPYGKSVYKEDVNDFDDFGNDEARDAYTQKPYEDEPPVKRSARRPRRR
jgi:uncharacterized RDD family membrane protein YckC